MSLFLVSNFGGWTLEVSGGPGVGKGRRARLSGGLYGQDHRNCLFLVSNFGGWTLEMGGGPEMSLGPSGKAKWLSAANLGENLTSVWSRSQELSFFLVSNFGGWTL